MNVTKVFTEATDAAGWFFGTAAAPAPTASVLPSGGACTLTEPTRCGIYGAAPSLQPLLILIWLGFLLWALFGNGCLLAAMGTTMDMEAMYIIQYMIMEKETTHVSPRQLISQTQGPFLPCGHHPNNSA
uniref:Uncharacterized protein n=1 Tax=Branchiostoma floridae TaxID=7739 RepID=C3ZDX3_BRAFL|eukprot:XP_002592918.1 hypothetical protein BRAFLDRAFT_65506 [Branchiostoma floridae]